MFHQEKGKQRFNQFNLLLQYESHVKFPHCWLGATTNCWTACQKIEKNTTISRSPRWCPLMSCLTKMLRPIDIQWTAMWQKEKQTISHTHAHNLDQDAIFLHPGEMCFISAALLPFHPPTFTLRNPHQLFKQLSAARWAAAVEKLEVEGQGIMTPPNVPSQMRHFVKSGCSSAHPSDSFAHRSFVKGKSDCSSALLLE